MKEDNKLSIQVLPNQAKMFYGWNPFSDALVHGESYNKPLEYTNWNEFYNVWEPADIDMNFVIDYYFEDINEDSSCINLCIWMAHPRTGHTRGICISNITQEDIPQIKQYLNKSLKRQQAHFAWIQEQ